MEDLRHHSHSEVKVCVSLDSYIYYKHKKSNKTENVESKVKEDDPLEVSVDVEVLDVSASKEKECIENQGYKVDEEVDEEVLHVERPS